MMKWFTKYSTQTRLNILIVLLSALAADFLEMAHSSDRRHAALAEEADSIRAKIR